MLATRLKSAVRQCGAVPSRQQYFKVANLNFTCSAARSQYRLASDVLISAECGSLVIDLAAGFNTDCPLALCCHSQVGLTLVTLPMFVAWGGGVAVTNECGESDVALQGSLKPFAARVSA
jgi:hypothetical protein